MCCDTSSSDAAISRIDDPVSSADAEVLHPLADPPGIVSNFSIEPDAVDDLVLRFRPARDRLGIR